MNVIILTGSSQYDVLEVFSKQLAEGFLHWGIKPFFLDIRSFYNDVANQKTFLEMLLKEKEETLAVISYNGRGQELCLKMKNKQKTLLNECLGDVPNVSIMVDSPYYHITRLAKHHQDLKNRMITFVDGDSTNFARKYFSENNNIKSIFTLLHAAITDEQTPFSLNETYQKQKEYDIVFAGSIGSLDENNPQSKWQGFGLISKILDEIFENAVAGNGKSFHVAVDEVLLSYEYFGLNVELIKKLYNYMQFVDTAVRIVSRNRIIKKILQTGFKIDVFGIGWENTSYFDQLNIHKAVSLQMLPQLMRKSKIFLNVTPPTIINALHERILTAMANGAIVVTNYSEFCTRNFTDKEVCMYRWNKLEAIPDLIGKILKDEHYRINMCHNATKIVNQNHLFRHRAKQLIEMLDMVQTLNDTLLYPE